MRVPRASWSECARSIVYAAAPPPITRTARTATTTETHRLFFTLNILAPQAKITLLSGVLVRVDPHRKPRERLAPRGRDEPRVLHVEARAAVGADRVRMHGEDH